MARPLRIEFRRMRGDIAIFCQLESLTGKVCRGCLLCRETMGISMPFRTKMRRDFFTQSRIKTV